MTDHRNPKEIRKQKGIEVRNAKRQLRDQVVTIKHLGFKPHIGRQSINHIETLLKNKVIDLTKDPDGVRCFMEMRNGSISKISHAYIISLLDKHDEEYLIRMVDRFSQNS